MRSGGAREGLISYHKFEGLSSMLSWMGSLDSACARIAMQLRQR